MEQAAANSLVLVAATLATHGITHSALRLNSTYNNQTVTDGSRVFVKLTRPGFDTRPLALEVRLAAHFGSELMLRPLAPELLAAGDQALSVWAWEPMISLFSAQATPTETAAAAALIVRAHGLPVTSELDLPELVNFDFLRAKLGQRLAFARSQGLSAAEAAPLPRMFEEHLADVDLSPLREDFVLNHGDPHFGNFVRRGHSGTLTYIDWESAQLAPHEFDVAAMRVNLLALGQNAPGWAAAWAHLREHLPELDERRLELFTAARLISMTAYGLLHPGHYAAYFERVALIERYLSSGEFPDHFPMVV